MNEKNFLLDRVYSPEEILSELLNARYYGEQKKAIGEENIDDGTEILPSDYYYYLTSFPLIFNHEEYRKRLLDEEKRVDDKIKNIRKRSPKNLGLAELKIWSGRK